jgi:hypothetical protein
MHTANGLRHTEPLNRPPTWDQTPVCRGLELCRELLSDFAVCCVLPWASVAVCRESYFRRVLRFYLPWADLLPWAKVYGSRYKYQCRGSTHGKRSAHGKGGFSGSVGHVDDPSLSEIADGARIALIVFWARSPGWCRSYCFDFFSSFGSNRRASRTCAGQSAAEHLIWSVHVLGGPSV